MTSPTDPAGSPARAGTTIDLGPLTSESQRAWVAVVDAGASRLVELPEGRELSVGRSRSSGVVVDHHSVSRLHATLEWNGGQTVRLRDMGSRNGTFMRGARVEGTVEISAGTPVVVGSASLSILLPDPVLPDAPTHMVAEDLRSRALLVAVRRIASTSLPVLLVGETGVGKDLLARFVHASSSRRDGPFVPINCGAIPETVAESALFGHERGSFTGADRRHEGVFEAADGGTLLLDEVGELSPGTQARLLRTLESGEVMRVGSTSPIAVDVRVVAATHRDLEKGAEEGRFRRDLLYRLDVLRVEVPALRERPDDIVPLARHLLTEISTDRVRSLGASAEAALRVHLWPGNVRELRNAVARACTLGEDVLEAGDFNFGGGGVEIPGGALDGRLSATEKTAIEEALAACGGNQTKAARRLGITRRALIYRMEKHGLKEPPAKSTRGPSQGS